MGPSLSSSPRKTPTINDVTMVKGRPHTSQSDTPKKYRTARDPIQGKVRLRPCPTLAPTLGMAMVMERSWVSLALSRSM